MKNRIKELRKSKKLSQEAFGKELGVTKSSISNIENGRFNVTDTMIELICTKFNVNEEWLRAGKEPIYNKPRDETAAIVSELLDENNPFYDLILNITKTYQKLDPKSQTALKSLSKELLDSLKKEG